LGLIGRASIIQLKFKSTNDRGHYVILLLVSCFLLIRISMAGQLHVPLHDPIYQFIDRMVTAGNLPGFLNDTRPLRRDAIAECLVKLSVNRDRLRRVDAALLDEYIADYRSELTEDHFFEIADGKQSWFGFRSPKTFLNGMDSLFHYRDRREKQHLLVYETPENLVWFDWDEMVRFETKNDLPRLITQDAVRFSAQVGKHFSVYFDGYRYLHLTRPGFTDAPAEYKGGYYADNFEGGITFNSFDYSNAYMQYESPAAGIFILANEPLLWGQGSTSMVLSENASAFPYVGWQKKFGRLKFTFLHGSLIPNAVNIDSSTGEKTYARKYIVAHRWEMAVSQKMNFIFSELYIYGKRSPELVYMIPPILLWPTQHNLRDRDNATMAFEFEYFPFPGLKCYSSIFLDELTISELPNKYWANKQGYQAGLHFVPRLIHRATELRLEFTAVRPWTYTHYFDYNTFTHEGQCLGFYAGPNSQNWLLENRWQMTKKCGLLLSINSLRHGVNPLDENNEYYYPIGDDANQNYNLRNEDNDQNTDWLMGDIHTTTDYKIGLNYTWRKEIIFDLSAIWRQTDNAGDFLTTFQIRFDY